MRLLNIIGELGYGGAELLISQLAMQMAKQGTDVTIAVLGSCDKQLAATATECGVNIIRFDTCPNSPLNMWHIIKLVSRSQFDVVHVHLFPALYWGAFASAFANKTTSWVYTEHSTSNRRRRYTLLRLVEGFIYRAYDCVVCISAEAQRELQNWLPRLDKSVVIENGIQLQRFRDATPLPRHTIGLKDADVAVLMVGAFRREKNQSSLVKAIALLPVEFKLVLAGDGPELLRVKNLVNDLALTDRVFFLGAVHDVERVMKAADIYVLPSFFEGFGISAIEAATAGLPIIYSDVPGLANILDGAGLCIDPNKPVSIANAIKEIVSKQELRNYVVSRGKQNAMRFSLEKTETQHRRLYQSLRVHL